MAASIGQARRSVFKLLREFIEDGPRAGAYKISESSFACAIRHVQTNTRISVLASSGKTAQGVVRCPRVFADEPGSWEATGGQLLHEAIQTAQGKPGTNLRVIYIGTLAPATSGWWHDLVSGGSHGSTHVTALRGRLEHWATARELRRVNPLMWAFPESQAFVGTPPKALSGPRSRVAGGTMEWGLARTRARQPGGILEPGDSLHSQPRQRLRRPPLVCLRLARKGP